MNKSLITLVVGAVIALAITGPLLLKKQAEAGRLAVELDQLKATLSDAEKRALDAEDRLARQEGELERLRRGQQELLKLRGEVTQLRQASSEAQAAAAARLRAVTRQPDVPPPPPIPEPATAPEPEEAVPFGIGVFMPVTEMEFAGFDTPESVLETLEWAFREDKRDILKELYLSAEFVEGEPGTLGQDGDTLTVAVESLDDVTVEAVPMPATSGVTVLGGTELDANTVQLVVRTHHVDGTQLDKPMNFRRVGAEWRIDPRVIVAPPQGPAGVGTRY
jgi:hypothetical protein